jgi:copper chaperone
MDQYEITVEGMACTGCEENVTNAVSRVDGVQHVEADHESGSVSVTADEENRDDVEAAIHDAGYEVPG